MTDLRAGQLRHRLTIQSRSTAVGTRGQSTEVWADVEKRWGQVESLAGNEAEKARQIVATATAKITMRAPRSYALTTEHRVLFGSQVFGVGSISETAEYRDDIELLCTRLA